MKYNANVTVQNGYRVTMFSGEKDASDFVRTTNIPTEILNRTDLTANEKLVIGIVYSFQSNRNDFFASNKFIANSLGLKHERSAANILSSLENKGIITRNFSDRSRRIRQTIEFSNKFINDMYKKKTDTSNDESDTLTNVSDTLTDVSHDTLTDEHTKQVLLNKYKLEKKTNQFTRSQLIRNKEQIIKETQDKYPDKDCLKAMQEFEEKTEIKDYKYKNYKLAYMKWVRDDRFNQYSRVNSRESGSANYLDFN